MMDLPVMDMAEALFRANVFQLLPGFPVQGYPELYRQVLSTQRQAAGQYHTGTAAEMDRLLTRWQEPLERIRQRPGIIATFHTGSYRLLSLCLLRAGVPLALVVSGDVATREREQMQRRYGEMTAGRSDTRPLIILEAEDPHVIRKMCRLVAAGYYLLLYVDGNTGAAGDHRARSLTVPFLAGHLRVRQGIGMVSHLAGVPIYPVRSDWVDIVPGMTQMTLLEPIWPDRGMDRPAYAAQATRQLYCYLEAAVRQSPGSWECWRYVHQWLVLDRANSLDLSGMGKGRDQGRVQPQGQGQAWAQDPVTGPPGRWQIFREGERWYVLDAASYIAYQFV